MNEQGIVEQLEQKEYKAERRGRLAATNLTTRCVLGTRTALFFYRYLLLYRICRRYK
ncbi:hypothetical protein PAE9249_01481 [Paenibacillus sp. CECT 9249]|nr:hypothetical protein PAE9249_01481 [Paenibacillus sp. CECT 9249]